MGAGNTIRQGLRTLFMRRQKAATPGAGEAREEMRKFAIYPSLKGRAVLITGGASGIGAMFVEAFTEQGSRVVFLDISDAEGKALISRIGPTASIAPVCVHCDLTDSAALERCLKQIINDVGGAFDVVVNNAANDARHATPDVTPEFWDQCMAVNLKHQFFVSQAVIPGMMGKGRGVILNMSSISWMVPATGMAVYVASKAAIVGLTRTLAHEFGPHGIRVNCIVPGPIETARQLNHWGGDEVVNGIIGRQALKRLLQPEEVARLALFLAADDASGITNQSYIMDGGWV